ncbi:MAG: hypothetical protein EBE86_006100 [Hormoscilla sp. GUM202]|nr:hypothetical protein [Hormoscilla sp. GUM202]
MQLQQHHKKPIILFVKILSTVLIASAIALEFWHLYATFTQTPIPNFLNIIFGIERFAPIAHLLEGAIAAFSAKPQNQIAYGTYSFFVGTVGLLELFYWPDSNDE